jgi:predicted phage gp36 major capsid-like protein
MISEDGTMVDELKALQQRRKEEIEKLEQDLPLMEAQRAAFETEDLNREKANVLRDRIDGARNALDILRVTYGRKMPPQPWEQSRTVR